MGYSIVLRSFFCEFFFYLVSIDYYYYYLIHFESGIIEQQWSDHLAIEQFKKRRLFNKSHTKTRTIPNRKQCWTQVEPILELDQWIFCILRNCEFIRLSINKLIYVNNECKTVQSFCCNANFRQEKDWQFCLFVFFSTQS